MTHTKKALMMSIFSMVLCMAMLMGTTFAWFTDTASTGVNIVKAGNLDVELQVLENNSWVPAEGRSLTFDNAQDKIYWEPGCTHSLPKLRVVNTGDLALKYRIEITGIKGDEGLNKYIEWTITEDNKAGVDINNDPEALKETKLAAGEEGTPFTITGCMENDAPDSCQGMRIDKIGITVFATQDTVEADSNGTDYDADASYGRTVTVKDKDDFTKAVKEAWQGDTIRLTGDIALSSAALIGKNIDIDLNGNTLKSTAANTIKLVSGAKLTVKDSSDSESGKITNAYSGRKDATTVDLVGTGAEFTLLSGTVESNSKDDLYTLAIGSSKKSTCTVNIAGGAVKTPDRQTKSRAIVAGKGMILNVSGGVINGGLYGVDVYAGSVTNITGGSISANAEDGRADEYGTTYAVHAKGEAKITIGSLQAESTPEVKGIKFESSGVNTELPTINLIKGEITNPIYSMEAKYNYELFKLGIVADAPVTFTDNTAHFFLPDGLKMVKVGDIWKVTK